MKASLRAMRVFQSKLAAPAIESDLHPCTTVNIKFFVHLLALCAVAAKLTDSKAKSKIGKKTRKFDTIHETRGALIDNGASDSSTLKIAGAI